jgi:hypothetical protein
MIEKKYSYDRQSKYKQEFLYVLEKDNSYDSYEMRIFANNGNDAETGVEDYTSIIIKEFKITENFQVRLVDNFDKI